LICYLKISQIINKIPSFLIQIILTFIFISISVPHEALFCVGEDISYTTDSDYNISKINVVNSGYNLDNHISLEKALMPFDVAASYFNQEISSYDTEESTISQYNFNIRNEIIFPGCEDNARAARMNESYNRTKYYMVKLD
jgi:hypothetical protein